VTRLRVHRTLSTSNAMPEKVWSGTREMQDEEAFERTISIERKRTERSNEPFLLMLLEAGASLGEKDKSKALDQIVITLISRIRDTDIIGWYRNHTTIGVMYTGLTSNDKNLILSTILNKVSAALRDELNSEQITGINISFHFFPDDWDDEEHGGSSNTALYPDLMSLKKKNRSVLFTKRLMDLAGSLLMLMLCLPLFLTIAIAIKISSPGPVFFRQKRVGQYGKRFTFLKFRSMTMGSDDSIHREYIEKLIKDNTEQQSPSEHGKGIYKLTNDARVTKLGRFLRKTSMDELPQFINVLKGEMSLVGPRPPIPYELAVYQIWHRRRILGVKPGITGLWQVGARSSVKFDDMVRLDLRYATSWSLWLDIKILLETPMAVIKGTGAC
jgi:lipopolysaccharide/colanic/teichoic acid biosynthesis glycosyltransferase